MTVEERVTSAEAGEGSFNREQLPNLTVIENTSDTIFCYGGDCMSFPNNIHGRGELQRRGFEWHFGALPVAHRVVHLADKCLVVMYQATRDNGSFTLAKKASYIIN